MLTPSYFYWIVANSADHHCRTGEWLNAFLMFSRLSFTLVLFCLNAIRGTNNTPDEHVMNVRRLTGVKITQSQLCLAYTCNYALLTHLSHRKHHERRIITDHYYYWSFLYVALFSAPYWADPVAALMSHVNQGCVSVRNRWCHLGLSSAMAVV